MAWEHVNGEYVCTTHGTRFKRGRSCPEGPGCRPSSSFVRGNGETSPTPVDSDRPHPIVTATESRGGGGLDFDVINEAVACYRRLEHGGLENVDIKRIDTQLKALRLVAELQRDATIPARTIALEQGLRELRERWDRQLSGGLEPPAAVN